MNLHYNGRQRRTVGVRCNPAGGDFMSLQNLATIAEKSWLAVVAAAHLAVLAFCRADYATLVTPTGTFAAENLRFVTLTLCPLWLVLGPGPKKLRWIAIPCFIGVVLGWSGVQEPRADTQAFWLGLESAGILLLLSVVVRLCGGSVWRLAGQELLPPVQFSIRGLLITTTLAALCLAVGKWVYANVQSYDQGGPELNPLLARSVVSAGLATVSLAAWWAVFRPRRAWAACLGIVLLAAGCGSLMTILLHASDTAGASFAVWWLLHTLAIMGTLAPLRQLGFRMGIGRHNRSAMAASLNVRTSKPRAELTGVSS
jgi:hypothetical protein